MQSVLCDILKNVPTDFQILLCCGDDKYRYEVHRMILLASSQYFRDHIIGNKYYGLCVNVEDIDIAKQVIGWMYTRDNCIFTGDREKTLRVANSLGVDISASQKCTNRTACQPQVKPIRMRLRSGRVK